MQQTPATFEPQFIFGQLFARRETPYNDTCSRSQAFYQVGIFWLIASNELAPILRTMKIVRRSNLAPLPTAWHQDSWRDITEVWLTPGIVCLFHE